MVLLALVVERFMIGVRRILHGSLHKDFRAKTETGQRYLIFNAGEYTFFI